VTLEDGRPGFDCPAGPGGHEPSILGLTREEVLACYPVDGYDDDRPGMVRVHVAEARARAFKGYRPATLRRMADLHGVRVPAAVRGKAKAALALELALAGARP
jgi:hypothetical protein